MLRIFSKNVQLFIILLTTVGCYLPTYPRAPIWVTGGSGATSIDTRIPEGVKLEAGQTIELLPMENATGKSLEIPADQIFNSYMADLLKEKNLLNASPVPAAFVMKPKLIEYEPGNAFGRFLRQGLGTTVCTVHTELLDKKSGALVGWMESRQTVSVGGLYSVGADKYICERVADALMDEIDQKLLGTGGEESAP